MKKYIAFLFGFITLLTILLMNLTVAGDYICENGVCVYHDEIGVNSSPGGSQPSETTSTGGGGGGDTTSSLRWECEEEWSECSNEGIQTRICEDLLGYEDNRTETKDCIPDFTSAEQEQGNESSENIIASQNFFTAMTGAVIGTLGKGGTLLVSIFAFLIAAGFISVAVNKRKMRKEE